MKAQTKQERKCPYCEEPMEQIKDQIFGCRFCCMETVVTQQPHPKKKTKYPGLQKTVDNLNSMTCSNNWEDEFDEEFGYLDVAYRDYVETFFGNNPKTIPTKDLKNWLTSLLAKEKRELNERHAAELAAVKSNQMQKETVTKAEIAQARQEERREIVEKIQNLEIPSSGGLPPGQFFEGVNYVKKVLLKELEVK